MPDSSPLLDPKRLAVELGAVADRLSIVALGECPSTNTLLLQMAADGAPAGTLLVTDRQTAGRGSRGRNWSASPEASLTFSLLWSFPGGLQRLAGLSLAVGVGVVRGLQRCGAGGAMLKWPNDILFAGGKLGGILVELRADEEMAQAVIGIGLNLRLPEHVDGTHAAALAPAAVEQIVDGLSDPAGRHRLFAAVLIELLQVLDRFAAHGFAAVRDAWQAANAWQGQAVRLLRDGKIVAEGLCLGADDDGALLVKTATGVERGLSGDVSLRPL